MKLQILLACLCLTACASGPSPKKALDSAQSFCTDPNLRKKQEFLVYSYTKLPAGMRVSQTTEYLNVIKAHADRVVDHFTQILASAFVSKTASDDVSFGFTKEFGRYSSYDTDPKTLYSDEGIDSGGSLLLAWLHDNIFATWDSSMFPQSDEGLPLENGQFLEVPKGPRTGFSKCDAFFRVYYEVDCDHGLLPSFGESLDGWYKGEQRPYMISKHGLFAFILHSGFNLGAVIESSYFSVPERDRTELCRNAGYDASCFEKDQMDGIRIHNADKFSASRVAGVLNSEANPGGMMSNSGYGLDLIMAASTHITKKVQGDWIISRIEFDPSMLCKYAKSNSDFYTH